MQIMETGDEKEVKTDDTINDNSTEEDHNVGDVKNCEENDEVKEHEGCCNDTKDCQEVEVEEVLSEEIKTQKHEEALLLKEEANKMFKESNYEKAISIYSEGIDACPVCYAKTLAMLHSNRAAGYVKLEQKEPAIKDCTTALDYDSYYTKARLRRAQMYEATDKLEDALNDYNEILKYDKSCQQAGEAAMRLPGQINERNEKMKAEMLGKLKELGNMCLNPFGLSTDNFKMTQDPSTGGYSVNFQR